MIVITLLMGCSTDKEVANTEGTDSLAQTTTVPPAQKVGWYIRLNAKTTSLEDNGTVLGYLEGAMDGKDRYDSKALSAYGLYTTVYHEEYNEKEYRTDYRRYAKAGDKTDIWIIKVHSGDPLADVTLTWDGITFVLKNAEGNYEEEHQNDAPELEHMKVVDITTGEEIPVSNNSMGISFNMNGSQERTFKWMILKDE